MTESNGSTEEAEEKPDDEMEETEGTETPEESVEPEAEEPELDEDATEPEVSSSESTDTVDEGKDDGSSESSEEDTEDGTEEEAENDEILRFDVDQLPDGVHQEIQDHIEIFSNNGVKIVGLGNIDINDDSDFRDPEEFEEVNLEAGDINAIEMYCEIGGTRFIYGFLPHQNYNSLDIQYNVLTDLVLATDVEDLNSLEEEERVKVIRQIGSVLSGKDRGAILRINRGVEMTDLMSWLNQLRANAPKLNHEIIFTPDGEVEGVGLTARIYVPEDQEAKERALFNNVQSTINVARSYSSILGNSYLEEGVQVPDAIAEKLSTAVTDENWETISPQKREEDGERIGATYY